MIESLRDDSSSKAFPRGSKSKGNMTINSEQTSLPSGKINLLHVDKKWIDPYTV